jgi:chitodextrinase
MRFAAHGLLPARLGLLLAVAVVVAGSSAARGTSGADGLVAAYSFDDGTGSILVDESTSGNDGSIVGGASWIATGHSGGALSFDGSDDRVTIPDATTLDLTSGMTVEAWVKPSANGQRSRAVLAKPRGQGTSYALLSSQEANKAAGVANIYGDRTVLGPVLPLGTWSHLAATHDGSVVRLYVDGALVGSTPATGKIRTSSNPLVLGTGGNGELFAGQLDDVRVYNRALSLDELRSDMNTPVRRDTKAPSTPAGLTVTRQAQTELGLSWSPSTDDTGVTGYSRYLDGTLTGTGPGTSFTFTGLACGKSYTLAVDAVDAGGNRSARTSVVASTSPCTDTTPPPSSPVAAYSFDNGSGTTVTDVSGGGNNGTISGATWTTAGKFGGSLSFDGVDDLVTVADAAALDLTTGMTLEAWIRPGVSSSWRTIVTKEQSGNLVYGLFSSSDTSVPSGILSIGSSPTQDIVRGSTPLPVSTWKHLAVTYDGAVMRLYLDGAQVSTKSVTGAMPNSSGPLQIGGNKVWPEWFQGQIDDLRIYGRALSAAEILADLNGPVGGGSTTPPPAGDTQPPVAPTGLTVGGQTQSGLTVGWSASSDNVGVAGYGVYRNGTSIAGTGASARSYNVTGLTCGTTYTLGVDAVDAAGNRSTRSTVSGTTTACTSPPPSSGVSVAAGQSWQAAYDSAPSGSTITVLAGSHGTQRVSGSKQVTFLGQAGAVMRQFWNEASNLTLDNVDIDGGGQKLTILEAHGANNVYRNLEIRNNTDQQMITNAGSNALYDNVFFHDAVETSAGEAAGVHMECLWSNGPAIKVRNSTFKDCAIMDLYLTLGTWWGQQPYTGVVIEDNIFYPSERTNNSGTHFYGFLVNGALPVNGWSIKRNRFDSQVGIESPISNSAICGNTGSAPTSWKVAC